MNKKHLIIAVTITLIVLIIALFKTYQGQGDINKVHGLVDIRQASLSFERSGKIQDLYVDEGDKVTKGKVLARLDTRALDHQINIQEQQCLKAKANLDEITEGFRVEEINQAKANVTALENKFELASRTYDRYENLLKSHSVSKQQRDDAYFSMKQAKGQLEEAKAVLSKLTKGNRVEDIVKAKAEFDGCIANREYLLYQKNTQSVIKAPFNGVIRTRKNEVGDMASPTSTVFELSMLDKKRIRVYATQVQLENIKVGKTATVDNSLGQTIEGTVAYISDTAMFTPKTVQTEELRASLVYEVRVDVEAPDNLLRLGQPVSVIFNDK